MLYLDIKKKKESKFLMEFKNFQDLSVLIDIFSTLAFYIMPKFCPFDILLAHGVRS